MTRTSFAALIVFAGLSGVLPAAAQDASSPALDPAVAALMQKAAARGDGSLDTVTSLAIETNPDQADAIRAFAQSLTDGAAQQAAPVSAPAAVPPSAETAMKAEETAEKPASFWSFAGWDGEVELSANRYTGNTDQTSVGLGAKAAKEVGRWKHEVRGLVEFEEVDGTTSKQRYLAGYDINYTFNHRAYVFGNFLYEDDRFGGYDYRFSETAGLGYKVIDRETMGWSIEAGPGARHTNEINGGLQTEFVGLVGSKFYWDINERSQITHDFALFIGSDRTTVDTTAALKLLINGALSARLSYNYRYESSVPPGVSKTDTATKAALVYDF